MLPAGSIVRALYHKLETQSSAPEDGRNYSPKQVELIEINNKPLLLHLVGYLYYWQMGFNSVFKGFKAVDISFDPRQIFRLEPFYRRFRLNSFSTC